MEREGDMVGPSPDFVCSTPSFPLSKYQNFSRAQFYIPALSLDPRWIPYAFMASTAASVPLVMAVKEEYNRSRLDSSSFG